MQTIQAIYENGMLRPLESLNLGENEKVTLHLLTAAEKQTPLSSENDPLAGVRMATGIPDLSENFSEYRFGRKPLP